MSARLLLEVALRIMGLWFFLTSMTTLVATVSVLWSIAGSTAYLWGAVATFIAQFVLGGMLVFGAPAVARWFYPAREESEGLRLAVGPGDVYRTACFVLGAYLLVATAHPLGRLLSAGWSGEAAGRLVADFVTFTVYACGGVLLVFGSRPIAQMLSNLRYDPDTIPKQQLSLAALLLFIVLVAVVLGVFRMISLGP
jgi:hypothetical protein